MVIRRLDRYDLGFAKVRSANLSFCNDPLEWGGGSNLGLIWDRAIGDTFLLLEAGFSSALK